MYFFPQPYTVAVPDVTLQILKNVRCTGADSAHGYGTPDGHTIVRVAMQNWSINRIALAQQLWKLDDQGCNVQVMYGMRGRTDVAVLQALLKKGGTRHGGVAVFNSNFPDANAKRVFIHYKQIQIGGNYLEPAPKIVLTGSANFDWASLRAANEQMIKISDPAIYSAYAKQFNFVRGRRQHRLLKPISPSDAKRFAGLEGAEGMGDATEAGRAIRAAPTQVPGSGGGPSPDQLSQ